MRRSSRVRFYKKIRAALLATNKRTDSSIITECNIVMPIVNSKGTDVPSVKNNNKLVRARRITHPRTIFGKRSK